MNGKWLNSDLFVDELGVQYDGKMNLIEMPENIEKLFSVFDWETPLMTVLQVNFVKSLQSHFRLHRKLSPKQFKWLGIYYNMSNNYDEGLGDSEYFQFGNSIN